MSGGKSEREREEIDDGRDYLELSRCQAGAAGAVAGVPPTPTLPRGEISHSDVDNLSRLTPGRPGCARTPTREGERRRCIKVVGLTLAELECFGLTA